MRNPRAFTQDGRWVPLSIDSIQRGASVGRLLTGRGRQRIRHTCEEKTPGVSRPTGKTPKKDISEGAVAEEEEQQISKRPGLSPYQGDLFFKGLDEIRHLLGEVFELLGVFQSKGRELARTYSVYAATVRSGRKVISSRDGHESPPQRTVDTLEK